jgi:hypothetical protein
MATPRKNRRAEAERLMAALTGEETPLTITEQGTTEAGAPSDLDPSVEDVWDVVEASMLGGCYRCAKAGILRNDARYGVGRELWSICEAHRVRWLSYLLSPMAGDDAEIATWEAHEARLHAYQEVGVYRQVSPSIDLDLIDLVHEETSEDRLWRLVRHGHTDPALLDWIVAAHPELPADVRWLIERQRRDVS